MGKGKISLATAIEVAKQSMRGDAAAAEQLPRDPKTGKKPGDTKT